jgi:predicted HicB family RNase H-like nuclease
MESNAMTESIGHATQRPQEGAPNLPTPMTPAEKLSAELKEFEQVATELRSKLGDVANLAQKRSRVVQVAAELFGVAPTWVAFYRTVMGPAGLIRSLMTDDEYSEFESGFEHQQVLEMLTTLRSRDLPENDPTEPQRMITVRIPKSMHDAICDEANRLDVSVNKLCISRLVQLLDPRMIPSSQQKRRGRKPGAASNRMPLAEPNCVAPVAEQA